MISFLTDITVDGVALWVVLLICVGVFLGAFMDAIAGGGGIVTVPTYLMGLHSFPTYYALAPTSCPPASAPCFPLPALSGRATWTGPCSPPLWYWPW